MHLMPPSRTRILLALYVDYLIFAAIYQPVVWAADAAAPTGSALTSIAIFAVLRTMAWGLRLVLPGEWALGIWSRPIKAVDPYLRYRERWWTMAAGTLLVLEGSKNMVRWTQGLPVPPMLGSAGPEWAAILVVATIGIVNLAAGLMVLRTRSAGAGLGVAVLLAEMLATIVNREAFHAWAREATIARRAVQGVPIRDGEIELMQLVSTAVLPVVLGAGVLWLLAVAVRFRTRDREGTVRRPGEIATV